MSELLLIDRLRKAQAELRVPKSNYNSFGKYKYRSAEDILEAVKPVNDKHELTLTLTDEPVLIGDWHYIKATATIHHKEETHTVTAYARESATKKGMDDSQISGTASSYARKYALNGLYLIDDTKDADTDEYQQTTQINNFKAITQKQVGDVKTKVMQLAKMRNVDAELVYGSLNISDVTKLSQDAAKNAINTLDKWLEQAGDKE